VNRLAGVQKIAVLRANALGDLIFTLPALQALRAAYPQAELVLLGTPLHEALLTGRPGPVDRVVVVPPSRGVRTDSGQEDAAELEAFFARMAAEQFDLALQLHGGGRWSNPFTKRLHARVTAGLHAEDAEALDRNLPYIYFQNEVFRYLEAVALVGARPVVTEPQLDVLQSDLDASLRVLPDAGRPLVALHPGASDPRRRWPAAKFAAVADALSARGLQPVITGNAEEQQLAGQVAEAMHSRPAPDLAGQLSLPALTGLLARCALVVSNDTGPLHLAASLGTPTVGIFWCGNLINAGWPTRSQHRPLVSWQLECPECGVNCMTGSCEHRPSFVADVQVAEVVSAAVSLLQDR
jgi:ADP-heptose:LPS heptosyltransferase